VLSIKTFIGLFERRETTKVMQGRKKPISGRVLPVIYQKKQSSIFMLLGNEEKKHVVLHTSVTAFYIF